MKSGIRELVFVVLLMALPAGMYLKVFKPRAVAEKQMQDAIDVRQKIIYDISEKRVTAISNLNEDIQALKKAADDANKRLPDAADADDVMSMVSRLAAENKVVIQKIETLKAEENKDSPIACMVQRINVELEGNFKGVYSLLLGIEQADRLITVKELQLDKIPEKQGEIKVLLDLQIYFKSANNSVAAGGAR